MTRTRSEARWPVVVWAMQLLPAIAFIALAVRMIGIAGGVEAAGRAPLLLGIVGAAWCLLAAAPICTPRGRRWLRASRREWALLFGSIVLATLLGDIALTVSGTVPTIKQIQDRSLAYTFYRYAGYRMVPKEVIVAGDEPIQINSRGFRGPEISARKPAGRKRMVFVGGSQIFDYRGGGWPAMVGVLLREQGHDVDIINAGVPGHNSTDSLRKLLTDIWTLKPDIVFVCNGWNDVKYFPRIRPDAPYRELPPAQPVTLFKDWRLYPSGFDSMLAKSSLYRLVRLRLVSALFTEEGRDVWQATRPRSGDIPRPFTELGPRQYELNLRLIGDLAAYIGATPLLCKQARLRSGSSATGVDAATYALENTGLEPAELDRAFDAIGSIIDQISAETGLRVVDMEAHLSGDSENFYDAIHFSKLGSQRAAGQVATVVHDLLEESRSP